MAPAQLFRFLSILLLVNQIQTTLLSTRSVEDLSSLILSFSNRRGALVIGAGEHFSDELLGMFDSFPYPIAIYEYPFFISPSINLASLEHYETAILFANFYIFNSILKPYHRIRQISSIKDVIIVLVETSSASPENAILRSISNEPFILAVNRERRLDIYVKTIENKVHYFNSTPNLEKNRRHLESKHIGRHLTVATLNYPPLIIIENRTSSGTKVKGIEPAIIELLAETLKFTYNFIFATPTEMWGVVEVNGPNVTCTGLLGYLQRNEAEIASGDLYVDYTRMPCIGYSQSFKMNYECLLVPASKPYPKWTALYHPLTLTVWLVTALSFLSSIWTLRFVAKYSIRYSNLDRFFGDSGTCFLFTFGNLLGVQQPQEVRATANRLFLITWLIAATIIPTGYRSGLISHMTFRFSPPSIDTIAQLIESSLGKVVFGEFVIEKLKTSPNVFSQKLATQLVPSNDLEYMYSLVETGQWAMDSSQDNLRYIAATRFPPTKDGPRVHLMRECLLHLWTAFGLRKNSQIKPLIDKKLMQFVETGLIEYHTSEYAKKLAEWNPKANSEELVSFSLDSHQGTFYLYLAGVLLALFAFGVELAIFKIRNWIVLRKSLLPVLSS